MTALRSVKPFVLGLDPPHSVVNVEQVKQGWFHLLHLIASHRPACLQRDYTTILLQVGDVMPVQALPNMWEAAMMILTGNHKRSEIWIEGQGDVPCPELCCSDKYKVTDGYLTLANNEFLALNKATKYSILFAQGEGIVLTFI